MMCEFVPVDICEYRTNDDTDSVVAICIYTQHSAVFLVVVVAVI